MSQGKSDYYLGIDLGTTNSVISWGSVRRKELDTQVINIPMMIEGGGMGNKDLLPSFVYFGEGTFPVVGEYAKTIIGRQTGRVVRSIKSHMGTQESFDFDGKTYDPAEISCMILKQLASGAQNISIDPEQVVITVPASFDSDQRSATIKAAELAGFQVTLFDEPRAALYDFANRQEKGALPPTLIDFETPKLVLVFDLGGGTLDVSLHKVCYEQNQYKLDIQDIAIGRYTRLGGDDFDKLLADHLLEAYSNRLPQNPDDYDLHLLEREFQVYAENAKIELSTNATLHAQQRGDGWEPDDISTAIIQYPFANPGQMFQYNLTLTGYNQVVEPLLAPDLTLDSVDSPDPHPFQENIIYPILDVLRKAKDKLQLDTPPKVDAVLLNGGMTRLYTIQKRLETFFGFRPIVAGDPDRAVARGASVYHYLSKQGYEPSRILNDTIGIGFDEDQVRPLVEAGTILPLSKPKPIEGLKANAGAHFLSLSFYLGSRLDTNPPNRKILERRVQLDERPFFKDEPIFLQVTVDEQGILGVEGWPKATPEQKFTVTVNSAEQDTDSSTEITERAEEATYPPKQESSSDQPLDVKSELEFLSSRCSQYMNTYDRNRRRVIMDQITQQRSRITRATNAADFITPLIEDVDSIKDSRHANNFFNARTMILLGDLAPYCSDSDQPYDICDAAIMLSNPERLEYAHPTVINTIVRYAIEAIGKTGLPSSESHLIGFLNLNQDKINSIRPNAIYSIGKCCYTVNAVKHLEPLIKSETDADRIAVNWALGKIGSRERGTSIPIKDLHLIISSLLEQLEYENHNHAQQHGIYAIGEICDRRDREIGIVPDEIANNAIRLIKTFSKPSLGGSLSDLASLEQQRILRNFAEVAIRMIEGVELSSDQKTSLLAIREADY